MKEEERDFFDSFKGNLRLNVPVSLMKDKNVKPIEKLTYQILDLLSSRKGYCWASNSELAKILNVTSRTIVTTINKLEKKGYIKKEVKMYKGQTRKYIFTIDKLREIETEEKRKEISQKDYQLAELDWLNYNKDNYIEEENAEIQQMIKDGIIKGS